MASKVEVVPMSSIDVVITSMYVADYLFEALALFCLIYDNFFQTFYFLFQNPYERLVYLLRRLRGTNLLAFDHQRPTKGTVSTPERTLDPSRSWGVWDV